MKFNTIEAIPTSATTVLLRADLNVPMGGGKVTDDTRLTRLVPTIRTLQQKGLKIVILSHFGRPKGRSPEDSLRPVAARLSELLGEQVFFAEDCIGEAAKNAVDRLEKGQVLVLENLRYHAGEEKNDPEFAAQLAVLGDVYVNDAFSASHRAHASIEKLAQLRPAFAGNLMRDELNALESALGNPQRPAMAIVGGSKISTKLALLENLVKRVDFLFLGGGMANTFLMAQNAPVGKSLCEPDLVPEAKRVMAAASAANCKILLPVDRIAVREFGPNVPFETIATNAIAPDQEAVDIGPKTIAMLREKLGACKTVLWNGPMGVFEVKPFDRGTSELARAVGDLTKAGKLISVAGGGDTVAALEQAKAADDFTYVSAAGGAFLEWLEGKILPGVAALYAATEK
jgi:phosphoglycerate kinase